MKKLILALAIFGIGAFAQAGTTQNTQNVKKRSPSSSMTVSAFEKDADKCSVTFADASAQDTTVKMTNSWGKDQGSINVHMSSGEGALKVYSITGGSGGVAGGNMTALTFYVRGEDGSAQKAVAYAVVGGFNDGFSCATLAQ